MGSINTNSMARKWRDLSGQNKWKGALDPLDIDLRRYIIHYGQLAQAAYDAFNSEKTSKYAGNSLYSKKDLFSKVCLEKGNPSKYVVTKFIYATSRASDAGSFILKSISKDAWSMESNWMGYVAVATDEGKEALGRRDIVVAWRGTIRGAEWAKNFHFYMDPAPLIFGDSSPAEIHNGFYSIYTSENPGIQIVDSSARSQVLSEISRLVELYKKEEVSITITGHSLGAALGIINAVDIVANKYNITKDAQKTFPVTAFAFGTPHVGNSSFAKIFSNYKDLRALLIRNEPDIVPKILDLLGYSEVGEELVIDTRKSTYLKSGVGSHNMEAYLHGVAGTQGKKGGFNLEVNRDISLVNKSIDGLKDEYLVPVAWRIRENKGMVQQSDGTWKMVMDHDEADILPFRPN